MNQSFNKFSIYLVIDIALLICFIVLSLCKSSVALLIFSLIYFVYLTVSVVKCDDKNKIYFIARSIFLTLLIGAAVDFKRISLLCNGNVWHISILVSLLILFVFCFIFRKELRSKSVLFFLIAVMNLFLIRNTMITASEVFAYHPVSSGVGEITDSLYSQSLFGKPGTYSVVIETKDKKETIAVVDKEFFYQCKIGDKVNYTVFDGLFGEKYLEIKDNLLF